MNTSLKTKLELILSQCIQNKYFLVDEEWFYITLKSQKGDFRTINEFNSERKLIEKYLSPYKIHYKIIEHRGSDKKEVLFYVKTPC